MNTEITDKTARRPRGWIFFDNDCRFCVAGRRRWGPVFERRGYQWLPLQTPGTAVRLGITHSELMAEMWVLPAKGRPLNGVNAWIELMRRVWWLWPGAFLLRLPGLHGIGQTVYRWIARNRYCIAGRCNVPEQSREGSRITDLVWLAILLGAALVIGRQLPPWVFMWVLAFALGFFLKWLTFRAKGRRASAGLVAGWFLLWPGLDARAFFNRKPCLPKATAGEWAIAAVKLLVGVLLIWMIAPTISGPIAKGWLGMLGIILCLHFGCFHLLSLAWRAGGVNAKPIMNRPLVATSLIEFWSERWNTAFSIPARRFIFAPLARRFGVVFANGIVFLTSGLIHELVISVPARGGYGLPTAYFALQGAAVIFERSQIGRRFGLGHGARGWLFMFLITALPVFWLFHLPFIHKVILPMLRAMGAN